MTRTAVVRPKSPPPPRASVPGGRSLASSSVPRQAKPIAGRAAGGNAARGKASSPRVSARTHSTRAPESQSLAARPALSFPAASSVRFAPPRPRAAGSDTSRVARWYAEFPAGWLRMEAEDGLVVALTGARPADAASPPPGPAIDEAPFKRLLRELRQYFDGRLETFSTPIALRGTPFQESVWRALLALPFGEVVTYRDIATRVGQPAAVRAVGAANGRNPIGIIVPCHRVIGSDRSLTGYSGGVERKAALLELEKESRARGERRSTSKARPPSA
jgi:methylated-DNA-[protein]-cysteine S-methyltransferase